MTNYFGIGEDGRIGLGFELHRTTNRYCNKAVYFLVGCCNFFCPWTRGLTISDQIEYVKTYASTATSTTNDGSSNEQSKSRIDTEIEEYKESPKEKLLGEEESINIKRQSLSKGGKVLFSTKQMDKKNHYLDERPIAIIAPNINSYAGGQSDIWTKSYNKCGLQNPYGKKNSKSNKKVKQMVTAPQKLDDDKLEFVSFYNIPNMGLGRGFRVA